MSQGDSPAVLQALELLEAPRSRRPSRDEALPQGILALLRIVAGDRQAVAAACEQTGANPEKLREAAVFYIEQVLFAPDSDPYRVLGLNREAPAEQLKEHHRWLVRWLHPDRNADEWEAVFADRVNLAWQELRTPERRRVLDQALAGPELPTVEFPVRERVVMALHPVPHAPVTKSLRWLSQAIFAGLAVSAVLALGVLYALHRAESLPAVQDIASASAPEPSAEPELQALVPAPVAMPAALPAEPAPVPVAAADSAVSSRRVPEQVAATSFEPAPVPAARATETASRRTRLRASGPESSRLAQAAPLPPPDEVNEVPGIGSAALAPVPLQPSPSVAVATHAPPAVPTRPALDDEAANAVLAQFAQLYRDGDLERLEQLLTEDARSGHSGRKGLISEYARLFANSEKRLLSVSNVSWMGQSETATIVASFEAAIWQRRSGSPRRLHGDLRLDLRMDQGRWRIYRLLHAENRG